MYKKLISTMLFLLMLSTSLSAFAYSDCDNAAVEKLSELNVLSGYEDGTFKPNAYLSRAELSKIIAITAGGRDKSYTNRDTFSDVDIEHWAWNYIVYCKQSEFINGYEDGTFKPKEYVTLAEALKAAMSAAGYNILVTEETDNWSDVWMNLAYEYEIIDPYDEINPNDNITRAEAAELILKAVNLPLCLSTGFSFTEDGPIVMYEFSDGENFESLSTKYLQ